MSGVTWIVDFASVRLTAKGLMICDTLLRGSFRDRATNRLQKEILQKGEPNQCTFSNCIVTKGYGEPAISRIRVDGLATANAFVIVVQASQLAGEAP